jgi:hypothetical protein
MPVADNHETLEAIGARAPHRRRQAAHAIARYGELDTFGLTRTDRWSDPRSADRYRHGDVSEESRRADWLPVERKARKRST